MPETPCFSVGQATTPGLSLVEELAAYREAGADAIGLADRPKLHATADALERVRASGLKTGFCIPSASSILPRPRLQGLGSGGPDDPSARVEEACRSVERLAPFEPQFCVLTAGPLEGYEPQRAHEIVVDGFRRVARHAADVGVRIGFEPLHSSMDAFTYVHTLPQMVELMDEVDEPNTGLLVDFWNLWDTPDVLTHIRANASRTLGVHVNDWRDPTRGWCDRVLPGDGIIDIPGMLRALEEGGFDGWYELEVMSDDGRNGNRYEDSLWERDPVELIRTAREQFIGLWRASRDVAPTS